MNGLTPCHVRRLGVVDYATTLARMQTFTAERNDQTVDEIWLLEHPPVYTLGIRARKRTLLASPTIAVAYTDRGGDVTYHGLGQPVVYVLLDIARRHLGIHELVRRLEQSVIDLLLEWDIHAERRAGAPGVYVEGRKIASLGLRVRAGRSYHGLAFNAAMDLAPFNAIDPCGYPGLAVTDLAHLLPDIDVGAVGEALLNQILRLLGYTALPSASN